MKRKIPVNNRYFNTIDMTEYGSNDIDVFDPSAVVQTLWCITLGRDTLQYCRDNRLPFPEGAFERLQREESYVREQIQRWGTRAIDEGLEKIGLGHPEWEAYADLFPAE